MLVFGKGWLGPMIAKRFQAQVVTTDILDLQQVGAAIRAKDPDVVINAAGVTGRPNVDWCELEENRRRTLYVNGYGPAILEQACRADPGRPKLVHLSTGCLWLTGSHRRESDTPAPPSWYSHTKWEGEKRLHCRELGTLVLRPRMPIYRTPHPRNFITKLTKYIRVIDIPNSVTFIESFLDALAALLEKDAYGAYHMVNPGALSAIQVMAAYKAIVDPTHEVRGTTMAELMASGQVKAKRSNVTLDTYRLSRYIELPDAETELRKVLIQYKEEMEKDGRCREETA